MYYAILLGFEVVLAVLIIFLILVYRGKGADVGAVFSGSTSVFGAKGSVPFTTKLISVLCAVFIVNSLALTYMANRSNSPGSSVTSTIQKQDTTQTGDVIDDGAMMPSEQELPSGDIPAEEGLSR